MALPRAVATSRHCVSCQFSVLRSFASIAGVRIAANYRFTQIPSSTTSITPSRGTARYYSSEASSPVKDEKNSPQDIFPGSDDPTTAVPSANTPAPLPWYLQASKPQLSTSTTSPIAARQSIPELPSYSPPILSDFLNHVSVDLGLDDLTLLDLRDLDPPPGLGANLIMIIGTARSEKHLHVSADRFCRWLRSTYKLSPRADGLLGRNELKLKLRRKAKKSRMMANIGAAQEQGDIDDGIRTGWVCVAVGEVEAAKDAPKKRYDTEGFVGFREEADGVNVVVQMLTEERRYDVDLEGLWSGILRKSEADKERAAKEKEHGQDLEQGAPSSTSMDLKA